MIRLLSLLRRVWRWLVGDRAHATAPAGVPRSMSAPYPRQPHPREPVWMGRPRGASIKGGRLFFPVVRGDRLHAPLAQREGQRLYGLQTTLNARGQRVATGAILNLRKEALRRGVAP